MSMEDNLRLERYKLVTDRQKYFTELARGTFASYMRAFTVLASGGIALVSTKSKLELQPRLLLPLLDGIVYLIAFLGVAAIGQIIFCLVRWHGFRRAERKINPDSPEIRQWWWVFEGLYCTAIAASTVAVWVLSRRLSVIIEEMARQTQ